MANFIHSPCTPADYPAMAAIFRRAFDPSPLHQTLFPAVPAAELDEWSIARSVRNAAMPEYRQYKLSDATSGRVVAFVRYEVPHVLSAEEKAQRPPMGYPPGTNMAAFQAFFDAVTAAEEKHVVPEEMYAVHLLAVDPEFQRLGLGRRLLEEILALADRDGKRAYIEASPEGLGLYRKLGWVDVDEIPFDLSHFGGEGLDPTAVLIRQPRPVSTS